MAYLETLLIDMKKGGIRINKNESTKLLENITNWDMQSTIFLALQVMGSVGMSAAYSASHPKYTYSRNRRHKCVEFLSTCIRIINA